MSPYDPAPRRPLSPGERRGVAVFLVVLLSLVALELGDEFTPRKLGAVFAVAFWVPMLVVHEWGHALVARLVGWSVYEIVLGFGPELGRFRIGPTRVVLRAIIAEGYVKPAPNGLKGARLKNALVYFGGPGAELLVVLILYLIVGGRLFERSDELPMVALQGLALAATLGVVMTLVPHRAGGAATDGLGILLSPFIPQSHFAHQMVLPALREAERLLDQEDARAAWAVLNCAVAEHPDSALLRVMQARCLAANGDVQGALSELEELRTSADATDVLEAERLHAAAWVGLESDDRSMLEDAEGACLAALERMPDSPEYLVTLGAVHLRQGHYQKAGEALQKAYRAARDPWLEDRCLAYLSALARARGQLEEAQLFARALRARTRSPRLLKLLEAA